METAAVIHNSAQHKEQVIVRCPALSDTSVTQSRGGRNTARHLRLLVLDSILYTLEGKVTHEISRICPPEQDQQNNDTSVHTTMDKGNLKRSHP